MPFGRDCPARRARRRAPARGHGDLATAQGSRCRNGRRVAVCVARQAGEGLGGSRTRNAAAVHRDAGDAAGASFMRRTLGCCVLPLAEMKAFGKSNGASVNDVLLTVVDMALNRYLARKREACPIEAPLVADMPVALPPSGQGGNAIAVLQFPLGAASADPMERLRTICRRTAEVKQHVKDGSTWRAGDLHGGRARNTGGVRAARDRPCADACQPGHFQSIRTAGAPIPGGGRGGDGAAGVDARAGTVAQRHRGHLWSKGCISHSSAWPPCCRTFSGSRI